MFCPSIQTVIKLAWLLVPRTAFAAETDPAFQPPPPEMTNTKYANDCGGVSSDLSADMPPVDDQLQSPWCETFSVKALLEYQHHLEHPGDHYENRISAADLNSMDRAIPKKQRGKAPDVGGGTQARSLLLGVQSFGKVYNENDLPFDQAFFNDDGLLGKLSDYYDEEQPFAATAAGLRCRPQDDASRALEKQLSGILKVLRAAKSKDLFENSLTLRDSLLPKPKAGAQRMPLDPFNIEEVSATTGDELLAALGKNLQAKKPSVVNVCADQIRFPIPSLEKIGAYEDPSPTEPGGSCGLHALDVVGMKVINGACQVELRNSWGPSWGSTAVYTQEGQFINMTMKPGTGYAWFPAKQFLGFLNSGTITSLATRQPGSAVKNSLAKDYDTKDDIKNGYGTMRFPGGTSITGWFKNGQFLRGTVKGLADDSGTYSGEYSHLARNGEGILTDSNGAVSKGTFKDGRLITGTFDGLWDKDHEIYYRGPIANGKPTAAGKFFNKDGQEVQP